MISHVRLASSRALRGVLVSPPPYWSRGGRQMAAAVPGAGPPSAADAAGAKAALRIQVKGLLKQAAAEQMAEESLSICRRVLAMRPFQASRHLGVYVHCARLREVDTSALLAAALARGATCYVPVVADKQSNMRLLHVEDASCLVPVPPFGILEPPGTYADGRPRLDALLSDQPLDLLVVPGLAFDTQGRRLGRGGGYYDKALTALRAHAAARGAPPPLLVALALRAQMVAEVPVAAHDAAVDVVVTPDAVHLCSQAAVRSLGHASDDSSSADRI